MPHAHVEVGKSIKSVMGENKITILFIKGNKVKFVAF